MKQYVIHIDNGHGTHEYMRPSDGKHSPDNRLYEGDWNRDIAARLQEALRELGYDARLVVPEDMDISLQTRCDRVNEAMRQEPTKSHLFVSIHINAAPSEHCDRQGWCDSATGWTVYVSRKSSEASRRLAQTLYAVAQEFHLEGNRVLPPEKYLMADFKVLRSTNCPAVLTESLFMTNHKDVDFLLSEEGRETIVNLHLLGLCRYLGHPAPIVFGER